MYKVEYWCWLDKYMGKNCEWVVCSHNILWVSLSLMKQKTFFFSFTLFLFLFFTNIHFNYQNLTYVSFWFSRYWYAPLFFFFFSYHMQYGNWFPQLWESLRSWIWKDPMQQEDETVPSPLPFVTLLFFLHHFLLADSWHPKLGTKSYINHCII